MPNAGPTTPNANMGPVSAQLMVLVVVFKSVAMVSNDTTNTVMVKLTVKSPASKTMSVAHARFSPMRRAAFLTTFFPRNSGHGITETSSTPADSTSVESRSIYNQP